MKRFISIFNKTLFLIALLSCFHCGHIKGPECIKNNEKYGTIRGVFRGKCWNYYERGLSYAEGGCFGAAIDDFQKAIHCVRDYCKIDQYMVPTYGLHFASYFPHREMGIVYYMKDDFDNAKKKLEKSLSDVDTERARYYLDLVRKKMIENEKIESGPKITTHNETPEIISTSNSFTLSGCVTDEFYISEIKLAGAVEKVIRYSWEGSEKRIVFNEELNLPQGLHKLIVIATNLGGKISKKELTIIIDHLGPIFFIGTNKTENSNILSNSESLTICGSIYDDSMVHSLTINDQKIDITPQKRANFCKQVQIKQLNNKKAKFIAKDSLGNISQMTFDLEKLHSKNKKTNLLAFNWWLPFDFQVLPDIISPIPGKKKPMITIEDPRVLTEVYYKGVLTEVYDEYENDFLFKLSISPISGKIHSVVINHKKFELEKIYNEAKDREDPHLKDEVLSFDHVVRHLKRGKNEIEIKAINTYGHQTTKTIIVIKKEYEVLKKKNALKMHIQEHFRIKPKSGKKDFESLPQELMDNLEKSERFVLTDKYDKAEYSIEGTITKYTSLESESIETKCQIKYKGAYLSSIINTFGVNFYSEENQDTRQNTMITRCVNKLTTRILRKFIRLKGEVKIVEGNNIYTNIQYEKLGLQKILAVYEKKDPGIFWYASVENQNGKNVQARLLRDNTYIKSGFLVITK